MNFQVKVLAGACALALGQMSGVASAAVPSLANCNGPAFGSQAAATAGFLDVFFSGASAPQNIIGALAANFLQTQTQIRSTEASGDPGASYRAYCGTLQNLPAPYAGLNGKKLRMVNRAKGGSGIGVYPIALNASVGIMALETAVCNAAPSAGYQFVCPESGTAYRPDMGVSDVEPRMFKGPYNLEPDFPDQLTSAQLSALNISNTFDTQFGLAATTLVTPASFSRTEITSILSGRVKKWSQLGVTLTTPAGQDWVHVCRRVSGSGTQATFNFYFNNFPCGVANVVNGGIIAPKGQSDSTAQNGLGDGTSGDPIQLDPTLGNIYAENSASGDVRNCLQRADNGQDHTYSVREFDEDLGAVTDRFYKILWSKNNPAAGGASWPAVGLLSLDSAGASGSGSGVPGNGIVAPTTGPDWNFKQLETLAPTQLNAASGLYDLVGEATFQYLPAHYTGLTDSANRLLFVQFFTAAAASESTLDNIAAPTQYALTANPTKNDIVGGGGGAPNCAWSAAGIAGGCLTSRWSKGGQSCSPAAIPQF